MKKIFIAVLSLTMIMSMGTTAFASHGSGHHHKSGTCKTVCRFVDKDHDGICDNYEKKNGKCSNSAYHRGYRSKRCK